MEKTMWTHIGQGIIFNSQSDQHNNIIPEQVRLSSGVLNPGEMTTLNSFFRRPVKYIGTLRNEDKQINSKIICFKFAHEHDLFEEKIYIDCFYLIAENRLFKKYNEHWGRDYNYINDKWK